MQERHLRKDEEWEGLFPKNATYFIVYGILTF